MTDAFQESTYLIFETIIGKVLNVLDEKIKECKADLPCLLKGYCAENVLNIYEIGHFFINLNLLKLKNKI